MSQLPRFEMLNVDPNTVARKPPLASALQSLETSIFLVGLRRYPAALTVCASAIESAIRAVKDYRSTPENDGLASALKFARRQKPARFNIASSDLFRETRNKFIHYGYSPQDDGKAVALLLSVGYPLLERSFYEFHRISLREAVINGLWGQIKIAKSALDDMRSSANPKMELADNRGIFAIEALAHAVAIGFNNPANQTWTDVSYGLADHEFSAMLDFKSRLESAWNFHVHVACPMPTCTGGMGCLVELDEREAPSLVPVNLFCFDCRLRLGANSKALIRRLVEQNVEEMRLQTLREYGLDGSVTTGPPEEASPA